MHAGGVVSGRRRRLVGSGVGMLAPHRRGVRLGSVHEGGLEPVRPVMRGRRRGLRRWGRTSASAGASPRGRGLRRWL